MWIIWDFYTCIVRLFTCWTGKMIWLGSSMVVYRDGKRGKCELAFDVWWIMVSLVSTSAYLLIPSVLRSITGLTGPVKDIVTKQMILHHCSVRGNVKHLPESHRSIEYLTQRWQPGSLQKVKLALGRGSFVLFRIIAIQVGVQWHRNWC